MIRFGHKCQESKKDEAQMLAEVLLDPEVREVELLSDQTSPGGSTDGSVELKKRFSKINFFKRRKNAGKVIGFF